MIRIVNLQLRQRQRLARQELVYLFEMVLVNVVITERVNKVSDFKLCNVRDQMRQQCIRTDIERHTEKRVRGALIKLAVKHAATFDFELKERVTRRKIDVVGLARIPTSNNQAARIRIGANLF